jgi:hypothetical protein
MAETITQYNTTTSEFIEAESKLYLDQLRNAIGGLKGADLSQIMGPQFIAGSRSFDNYKLNKHGTCWYWWLSTLLAISCKHLLDLTAYQSNLCLHINRMLLDTTLADYDIQAQKGLQGY